MTSIELTRTLYEEDRNRSITCCCSESRRISLTSGPNMSSIGTSLRFCEILIFEFGPSDQNRKCDIKSSIDWLANCIPLSNLSLLSALACTKAVAYKSKLCISCHKSWCAAANHRLRSRVSCVSKRNASRSSNTCIQAHQPSILVTTAPCKKCVPKVVTNGHSKKRNNQ